MPFLRTWGLGMRLERAEENGLEASQACDAVKGPWRGAAQTAGPSVPACCWLTCLLVR